MRETATREAEEESGVSIDVDTFIQAQRDPIAVAINGRLWLLHLYFAFYENETFQRTLPQKHEEWVWYSLPEVLTLITSGLLHSAVIDDFWLEVLHQCLEDERYLYLDPPPQVVDPSRSSYILAE